MAKTRMMTDQGREGEQQGEYEEQYSQRLESSVLSHERTGQERPARVVWGRRKSRADGMTMLNEEKLARGLGWFSLGLGVSEIAASRRFGKLIGLRGDHSNLFHLLGTREIMSGVG